VPDIIPQYVKDKAARGWEVYCSELEDWDQHPEDAFRIAMLVVIDEVLRENGA
jgi:hypothetical protein